MMKMAPAQVNEALYAEMFGFSPSLAHRRMIHIIEGAIKSYATVGLERTSYDRIAKICKISRPLIQHYFKDKAELFEMVVKYIRTNFQQLAIRAIQKESTPENQLMAYVESTFHWIKEFPNHAIVWKLVIYVLDFDPKLRELHTQMARMGLERITALLELGKSQNVFFCQDSQKAADQIQVFIAGALVKATTENLSTSLADLSKETARICLAIAEGKPI